MRCHRILNRFLLATKFCKNRTENPRSPSRASRSIHASYRAWPFISTNPHDHVERNPHVSFHFQTMNSHITSAPTPEPPCRWNFEKHSTFTYSLSYHIFTHYSLVLIHLTLSLIITMSILRLDITLTPSPSTSKIPPSIRVHSKPRHIFLTLY